MSFRLSLVFALSAAVAACGGSKSQSPAPSPLPGDSGSARVTVTIQGTGDGYDGKSGGTASFSPGNVDTTPGAIVGWTNSDTISHSVISDTNVFRASSIPPGGGFEFKFTTAGTYPYKCIIHPGMEGSVTIK